MVEIKIEKLKKPKNIVIIASIVSSICRYTPDRQHLALGQCVIYSHQYYSHINNIYNAFWPFLGYRGAVAEMEGYKGFQSSKQLYLIDIEEIYQMRSSLLILDLAFRFQVQKTSHISYTTQL